MGAKNIQEATVQEKLLTHNIKQPTWYKILQCNRPTERGKGVDLEFIVDSLQFKVTELNPSPTEHTNIEQRSIRVYSNGSQVRIVNVYISPQSSCNNECTAPSKQLMGNDDTLIAGHINTHSKFSHLKLRTEFRGNKLAEYIDAYRYIILHK